MCHLGAMKFKELIERVTDNGLFTYGQIVSGERRPHDLRRQLARWVTAGKVNQLRRGVYLLNAPYARISAHPFAVANLLKKASYVSLQSALAHYGMIPEYVPVTTSVTTGRPEELATSIGRFQFRHVVKHRFNGFTVTDVAPGQRVLLATPHKALVDLLYLTPHSDDPDYLRELRLVPPSGFEIEKLFSVSAASGSRKVKRAVKNLVNVWKDL